jgi:peptidoglycan/LPS O-acetylase OafA/YrhL
VRIGLQNYLYAFCPGLLIALAASARERGHGWGWYERIVRTPAPALIAAGLLWGLAYAMERSGARILNVNYQVPFVLASGLLLGTVVAAGPWIRPVVRVLAPVGLVSYGIYLWHDIVVQVIGNHTSLGVRGGAGAWIVDCVIVAAVTAPLAVLSWFAIERPVMRRAAAWARRHPQTGAPSAPPPRQVSARPPTG